MKPNSSFKLPKSIKVMLSDISNATTRGMVKRDFIVALLESNLRPRSKEDKNKDND